MTVLKLKEAVKDFSIQRARETQSLSIDTKPKLSM
jgi:hypothetical protein